MTLENDLKNITNEIARIAEEKAAVDIQEATLRAQISAIQLEIAKLRDKRYSTRQRLRDAEKSKESVERKIELERETLIIQQQIAKKREEAEALIADAPWRNVAFDWQIEGALKLPERALCGDKRGMGKTLTAIIWRRVHNVKKTLICLRKEVAYDFIKELGFREPGLFVYPMLGATPQTRDFAAMLLNHQENFVVVTNIESWRINYEKTTADILKIDYDGLILDEAHHIKNERTGTAQGFMELAQKIPKVLELTGTPIKNRPQEMYSLLHALYPDLFPTPNKFLADFCSQSGQNKWVFSELGLKSLIHKISGFYIARSPEDVGRQVPPPRVIEYKLDFESHPKQKEAYKSMTERHLAVLGSGKVIPIISQLAIMTRQAQVVSWPAGIHFDIFDPVTDEYLDTIQFDVHESVKMDWAEEFMKELVEEGERIVFFSRFKPAIYELEARLERAGISVAVITGDRKQDTKVIFNDFDLKTAPENPKYQVLLATYQTVGESANLNAARHMVLYDRFWNPGNEDQAIGRIDRINSIDQATVHVPLVESSIDEYMTQLIEEKRNIVEDLKSASAMQSRLVDHLRKTI